MEVNDLLNSRILWMDDVFLSIAFAFFQAIYSLRQKLSMFHIVLRLKKNYTEIQGKQSVKLHHFLKTRTVQIIYDT